MFASWIREFLGQVAAIRSHRLIARGASPGRRTVTIFDTGDVKQMLQQMPLEQVRTAEETIC